jgi:ribose/xylose/arabinose/galactoside ABC-type transport system permease subunit/ABC-type sugar transport system substrate-binding protein
MRRQSALLGGLLVAEILIFSLIGTNFLTAANGFEMARSSVELALLALALTAVIVTGGIDLSVGSMMGLCAVVFGFLWKDFGFSVGSAAAVAILVGLAGGALNAFAIAWLDLPPLIVTLGTYSLFRGLAEGLTGGVQYFSGFPPAFLAFGAGGQIAVLVVAIALFAVLLHLTTIGRGLYAIGCSPSGARYAGIPVARRLSLVYLLSGFSAAVAAVVYVAHIGQAKSDAGTGYELMAITAVVLGGTSIFGGRGSMGGTLLGLATIAVLQNGLRLAALPSEVSGILTGVLLIGSIAIDGLMAKPRKAHVVNEELDVKNSQVAVLSAVILAGALIVAASNWWLVKSVRPVDATAPTGRKITIGMMPKTKGDPYFVSCKLGAEEAAKELGVELIWDGPTEMDPAKQNEVVEGWITKGVSAIAVSVSNEASISTVLRKAKAHGIPVLTWDADAAPDARDFFVNQATPQGIGYTLMDEAARILGGKGEFAIVTGTLSAANQNEWIKFIKQRLAEKYSGIQLAVIRPSDDDRDKAFAETQTILKVYPKVRVIMGIATPAVPGAAEAVKQSGRKDVKVTGLTLPSLAKPYVHSGTVESIVLWDTGNLGYLTIYAADAAAKGTLKAGVKDIAAGRLGKIQISGDQVLLGAPFIFNASNIDRFNF